MFYTPSNFSKLLPIIEFHKLKLNAKIKALATILSVYLVGNDFVRYFLSSNIVSSC
jgi:hypothetical protein